MRQILQDLRSGCTKLVEQPSPRIMSGHLLIQSKASLISAGTERMLMEFGRAGYLGKARAKPDKVKQVLEKIRSDGFLPTIDRVFSRLDEPLPLGYCNVGIIQELDDSAVTGFRVGDRVVSNGPHAEVVCVPRHLCAKVYDGLSDEQATFTVLSSIGLQGIRLAKPTLGEKFVVYGLGLIGLLTVQLLLASGCEVLGVDINPERLRVAESFGAITVNGGGGGDPNAASMAWTEGKGVDGVLITASAFKP